MKRECPQGDDHIDSYSENDNLAQFYARNMERGTEASRISMPGICLKLLGCCQNDMMAMQLLNTQPSNCGLKLTACGTLAAGQNAPALARRSLTMRSAHQDESLAGWRLT